MAVLIKPEDEKWKVPCGQQLKRIEELEAELARLREEHDQLEKMRYDAALEAEEALEDNDRLREGNARLRAELAKQEAVMVAADRLAEAYQAMLEGRDVGKLGDWTAISEVEGN